MLTRSLPAVAIVALCFAPALTPAHADGPLRQAAAEAQAAKAADRAQILAMAGHYRVRFDMQETTPWQADYVPLERQISGGNEVVRVIEDRPDHIALQHLLVVSAGGQTHVIKHWRQDWDYQPGRVLVYAGPGKWAWEAVPERMRAGRWSQTVYQVDDSPRYVGWGRFETQGGIRRWRSNWTWRPLARRDAIRHPVYDRYYAINRHQPTPTGWIHWQDNIKMGVKQGRLVPIVQESVLNTYERSEDFDAKAADAYWTKTQDYWAQVRGAWAKAADSKGGIAIAEEAETGTAISARLLSIGDDIAAGKTPGDAGATEATALIERSTARIG